MLMPRLKIKTSNKIRRLNTENVPKQRFNFSQFTYQN